MSHFLRSQKICTALAVDSARGGERQHAAGNPDAACDIGARVKSSRRRVQFGRGRCEWYPLGLQRNFAGPTQNGSTFGHSFSTSSKHNQTTKPFSACERSRPLTHTGSLHVPIIALPAHQTNEPHYYPVLSSVAHLPPQLYPPNVPKKKVGRAQQGRREGCGQQLVIDRRVGSRLVVNGRKMEGRGGAGRGSATWFEVARQSKGKRWVKWDRGGGGGGVRDGGREQEEKAGGKSR